MQEYSSSDSDVQIDIVELLLKRQAELNALLEVTRAINSNVPSQVSRTGKQAKEVTEQNKKEKSQEIRQVALILRTNIWLYNLILDKYNNRLNK